MNNELMILSSPELVAGREQHIGRLARLFAGEGAGDAAFVLCGTAQRLDGARVQDAASSVASALKELASRADVLRDKEVFRPLTLECDIYGVHFTDKIFGTDVYDLDGSWQVHLLAQPVGQLKVPDLARLS